PAGHVHIRLYGNVRRVPVVYVVRRELEVPLQFSSVRVDGEQRARVEVVAGAIVAVVIRIGIAGAVVQQVEIRIVAAGHPRGRAASRSVLRVWPRLAGGLAWIRNRVEPPDARACRRVVGVDVAAARKIAAGDADDDLVPDDERSGGDGVRIFQIADGDVPDDGAGPP